MQRTLAGILSIIACAAFAGCAGTTDTPVAPIASAAQVSWSPFAEPGDDATDDESDSEQPYTLAVIGDTPYGAAKLAEFPSLVAKINADPLVRLVKVGTGTLTLTGTCWLVQTTLLFMRCVRH